MKNTLKFLFLMLFFLGFQQIAEAQSLIEKMIVENKNILPLHCSSDEALEAFIESNNNTINELGLEGYKQYQDEKAKSLGVDQRSILAKDADQLCVDSIIRQDQPYGAFTPISSLHYFNGRKCDSDKYGFGCSWTKTYSVPKDRQICNFDYKKRIKRNANVIVEPSGFVKDETRYLTKFRSLKIDVHSSFSTDITHHGHGPSSAEIYDINVQSIPINTTVEQRVEFGCMVPPAPSISTQAPERTISVPSVITGHIVDTCKPNQTKCGQLFEVRVKNNSMTNKSRMYYKVTVYDTFFRQRLTKAITDVTVLPKNTLINQYYNAHAENWKLEYSHLEFPPRRGIK